VTERPPARRWPFHDLRASYLAQRAEIDLAVARVLDGGWYVLGAEVKAFEQEFARAIGASHAIGVGNATDALELALRALGVAAGDDVAIPALTAAPTGMAVCAIGARPLLVDVEPGTLTMDPAALRRALTARTRVIVPVHLYGQCADLVAIAEIAKERGLPILEDCAQAHGATLHERPAGSFGAVAAWSFYPTKNLGAFGDGGALTTNDGALAQRLGRLRNYGAVDGYDFAEAGRNSRLDELHAAILRVKLRRLGENNERRRAHAARYLAELGGGPVTLPVERAGARHAWHQFVIRCPRRDALREHLAARGVETLVHYQRALHRMQAFAATAAIPHPPAVGERAAAEVLSLPIYPEMPREQQDAVIGALREFRA
jgi:dTDP-3-amino-3,4,6-trideoxy-alpha-D-glucose transaminase